MIFPPDPPATPLSDIPDFSKFLFNHRFESTQGLELLRYLAIGILQRLDVLRELVVGISQWFELLPQREVALL